MRVPKSVITYLNIGIDWLHIVNLLLRSKTKQALTNHCYLLWWFWGVWISSVLYFAFADPGQKYFFPPIWQAAAVCSCCGLGVVMFTGFAVCASDAVDVIHWLRDYGPRLKFILHVAATAWLITEPEEERGALLALLFEDFDSRPVGERHAILARAAGTIRHQHELALAEVIRSL
jgi:hypothetical protein